MMILPSNSPWLEKLARVATAGRSALPRAEEADQTGKLLVGGGSVVHAENFRVFPAIGVRGKRKRCPYRGGWHRVDDESGCEEGKELLEKKMVVMWIWKKYCERILWFGGKHNDKRKSVNTGNIFYGFSLIMYFPVECFSHHCILRNEWKRTRHFKTRQIADIRGGTSWIRCIRWYERALFGVCPWRGPGSEEEYYY